MDQHVNQGRRGALASLAGLVAGFFFGKAGTSGETSRVMHLNSQIVWLNGEHHMAMGVVRMPPLWRRKMLQSLYERAVKDGIPPDDILSHIRCRLLSSRLLGGQS